MKNIVNKNHYFKFVLVLVLGCIMAVTSVSAFQSRITSPIYYYDNWSAYAQLETTASPNGSELTRKDAKLRTNLSLHSTYQDSVGYIYFVRFSGGTPNYNTVGDIIRNDHS